MGSKLTPMVVILIIASGKRDCLLLNEMITKNKSWRNEKESKKRVVNFDYK